VYAYYFWLFPNLMLNFYPWGLSLNVVVPQAVDRTMVLFRTYRFKDKPFQRSANNLEQTEMEDEAVVEAVQTGVRSRYYDRGRYSPRQEPAVHHFHRLVAAFMRG
jgi:choline monooxygenase